MEYSEEDLCLAYERSINNMPALEKDAKCGCFHCGAIFHPSEIDDWVGGRQGTALCPYCYEKSVLGKSSGFPITSEFLSAMCLRWFGMKLDTTDEKNPATYNDEDSVETRITMGITPDNGVLIYDVLEALTRRVVYPNGGFSPIQNEIRSCFLKADKWDEYRESTLIPNAEWYAEKVIKDYAYFIEKCGYSPDDVRQDLVDRYLLTWEEDLNLDLTGEFSYDELERQYEEEWEAKYLEEHPDYKPSSYSVPDVFDMSDYDPEIETMIEYRRRKRKEWKEYKKKQKEKEQQDEGSEKQ